ncbi:LPXTG cell wall anchor domain-containing protein [Halolactibacillus sp. JCM 19043]|uniref:LPXTG cell wall anchor domain-containing protein n=1 Tax=Halolactibacillus sp. JCM 19043 TaxID=1460638 RepID=UPI000786236F|nr:LPXTG cell wall anchor domain-containing protein [Halolactibacillus sp. JCM 19043]
MKIDPTKVSDWTRLNILYVNDDNAMVFDHNADIISVDQTTGEVIMHVKHFSSYGLIEQLVADDNDDMTPPEESDDDVVDDDTDNPDDQADADKEEDHESDQATPEDDPTDESASPDEDSHEDNQSEEEGNHEALPETATTMYLFMYFGFWCVLLAGGWLMYRRQFHL